MNIACRHHASQAKQQHQCEQYVFHQQHDANFTASPWAYNGKLFCLDEAGTTFVVQAGPNFKVLGENRLEEMCMATPAIADRGLLIRSYSKLYRIGAVG